MLSFENSHNRTMNLQKKLIFFNQSIFKEEKTIIVNNIYSVALKSLQHKKQNQYKNCKMRKI